MRILVTGSTGLLGKSLCPMLDSEGWQYWACNSKIFDVTNTKMVNEIMNKISLDFIIHLAGYTNIDQAEDNPDIAYNVNQLGTRNVANIAKKHNIPILYVSTDNVFDGTSDKPYKTTDATNPINVYGKSKLAGELEIIKATKKHYILRTSWLYGIGGYVREGRVLEGHGGERVCAGHGQNLNDCAQSKEKAENAAGHGAQKNGTDDDRHGIDHL